MILTINKGRYDAYWSLFVCVEIQDHIRPSQEGSKNNVVEQLNHGHEDSVQKQVILVCKNFGEIELILRMTYPVDW